MAEPRRAFGPVVLLGLASGGLAAVAGHRSWVTWSDRDPGDFSVIQISGDSGNVPLAGSLALVLLACWGVVLVTRGRFRRLVAGLGLLVALGMLVTALVGVRSATSGLRADLARVGVEDVSTSVEVWFWVYLLAAVLALAACAAAVRWLPAWPEMGARYDAPGATPGDASRPEPTDLDLWRAMDDGRDPTLPDPAPRDP